MRSMRPAQSMRPKVGGTIGTLALAGLPLFVLVETAALGQQCPPRDNQKFLRGVYTGNYGTYGTPDPDGPSMAYTDQNFPYLRFILNNREIKRVLQTPTTERSAAWDAQFGNCNSTNIPIDDIVFPDPKLLNVSDDAICGFDEDQTNDPDLEFGSLETNVLRYIEEKMPLREDGRIDLNLAQQRIPGLVIYTTNNGVPAPVPNRYLMIFPLYGSKISLIIRRDVNPEFEQYDMLEGSVLLRRRLDCSPIQAIKDFYNANPVRPQRYLDNIVRVASSDKLGTTSITAPKCCATIRRARSFCPARDASFSPPIRG